MDINVFQLRGYPKNYYFVRNYCEWSEITSRMRKMGIKFLHTVSCTHGYGFTVDENDFLMFKLSWQLPVAEHSNCVL